MTDKIHPFPIKAKAGAATVEVRVALADTIDFHIQAHGPSLAGFAIVSWDHNGSSLPTTHHGARSPISDDMVVAYVASQLAQEQTLLKMGAFEVEVPKTEEPKDMH